MKFQPSETTLRLRARAYLDLRVTPESVAMSPQITPQLALISKTLRRAGQQHTTRKIVGATTEGNDIVDETRHSAPYGPGSDLKKSWPHYLSASDHADARKLLLVYHGIAGPLRPHVPIEAFCVAAGVPSLSILSIIVGVVVRFGAQASSVIAAVSQPRVVEKSVEMALTDEGIEDRTLLAKATGFLPSPKGAQTNITVAANASAASTATAAALAPPPEQTIRRLVDRLNEARGLPPAREIALPAADVIDEAQSLVGDVIDAIPSRTPEMVMIDDAEDDAKDDA